jgi:hypothetical protein
VSADRPRGEDDERGVDGAPERDRRPRGATEEHPLGDDLRHFEPTGPGSLADNRPLIDEDGDDIRLYTGEPVETEDGWVLPQQQNMAGKDNIAGRGEWPDPDAPAAQPPIDPDREASTDPDADDRR